MSDDDDYDDDFDEDDEDDETIEVKPPNQAAIFRPSKSTFFPQSAPTQDDGDAWVISYADMMTLIACFFILMMAFANYDPTLFSRRTKEISKHFSGEKNEDSEDKLEQLMQEIRRTEQLKDATEVKINSDGLTLTFSGSSFFESGKSVLKPEVVETIDVMIDLIMQKDSGYRIMVEGHTDDAPLRNSSRYNSNWELSGARSSRIVERFELFEFPSEQLVSIGYGSTRPLAKNRDNKGRAILKNMNLNRRVVIKVLQPLHQIQKKKFGFGVYFDDYEFKNEPPVPESDP